MWELVQLLPTQQSVVREITRPEAADWSQLLNPEARPGGLWRVLYALQARMRHPPSPFR